MNRILFRPLPISDPSGFFALTSVQGKDITPSFSYPNYKDLRDRTQTLAGVIAYRVAPLVMSHEGSNARLWGYMVSGNYFEVLRVKAAAGAADHAGRRCASRRASGGSAQLQCVAATLRRRPARGGRRDPPQRTRIYRAGRAPARIPSDGVALQP